jgi:OFA family oxalate/formate antiporter-like MFS transporter
MVFAAFNTAGRIVGGYLSDKLGRTNALLLVFLIQAANMFLFALLTSIPWLAIGLATAGLAYGALFALFPACTADFFGIKNLGVNYGIVFTSWGIAGIIGPLLAGRVADLTGNYNTSYIVAGVMLLGAALLVKLIKAPKAA